MKFLRLNILLHFIIGVSIVSSTVEAQVMPEPSGKLVTKTFRVFPGFIPALEREIKRYNGATGAGANPFADPESDSENRKPRKRIFDFSSFLNAHLGLPLPEGGFVEYTPEKGKMEIRHDSNTIQLIEQFLQIWDAFPSNQINIRAEIYQMPAKAALKIQQLCGPMDDHVSIWWKVQTMVEKNQASFMTSVSTIARSGQRARAESINEVIYPTEIGWDKTEEKMMPVAFETRKVGTILSVDPVMGSDGFTIELSLSLEHHTSPPGMRPISVTSENSGRVVVTEMPEFHTKRIMTEITLGNGSTKCIGAWRPTGKPEYEKTNVMQVVFVRVDAQTVRKIRPWKEEE